MQCILCYYELLRQAQHSFLQTYDVLHFLVKRMQNFLSLSKELVTFPSPMLIHPHLKTISDSCLESHYERVCVSLQNGIKSFIHRNN